MRSSVSPFRAAGARHWGSASEPWRWPWNRLSPCAFSNFRHMLTFIQWSSNVVNSSWAFRAPSRGTHPEVSRSAFAVMRRAALGVFGAVALACASAPGGAFALSPAVGRIHVDVAPLRENAGDPTAAWVAQAMPGALAQALAEVGRPGAPVSVRIDYVILGAEHRQRRRTGRLVSGPDGRGGDRRRRRPAAARTDFVLPGGVGPGHNRTVQLRSRFPTFARVRLLGRAGVGVCPRNRGFWWGRTGFCLFRSNTPFV